MLPVAVNIVHAFGHNILDNGALSKITPYFKVNRV